MLKQLSVGIIGPGLVGSEVVRQLLTAKLPSGPGCLPIKINGIANSRKMFLVKSDEDRAKLSTNFLADFGETVDLQNFTNHISDRKFQASCIVDCSSSEHLATLYPSWLQAGINIATPNKKAFSSSLDLFKQIQNIQQEQKVYCYHESTVGAGLPVLDTLNNMLESGDEVLKIEGILSGTMSFLFNSFSSPNSTSKFSEIVQFAKQQGYTEPDPRDDLNGVDVARKAVILGRLCGSSLDLSEMPVENIVPEPLRKLQSAEEFMDQLQLYDKHFEELNLKARSNGKVLRYVCSVEPNGHSEVALKEFDLSHPFAGIKGAENIVSFTTRRYLDCPLTVRGHGAGAAVTASGVVGDLLKIARHFS